jgi:hypothetical protein
MSMVEGWVQDKQDGSHRTRTMFIIRCIALVFSVMVLGAACTSGSTGSDGDLSTHHQIALPARLRSPARRQDCPLGIIRANAVPASKLSGFMKGHIPTWVPRGFGLLRAYGPYIGFGSDSSGGLGVWVTEDCRTIEAAAYKGSESLPWSIDGAAKGSGGCYNAVLGGAPCWSVQAPASGQGITVQTMGLSVRQTIQIVRSMHPSMLDTDLLCPPALKGRVPRSSSATKVGSEPVPGAPIALESCSYQGLSDHRAHSLRLTGASPVVDRSQIRKLLNDLDHLQKVPAGQPFACPLDTGKASLLRFAYRGGESQDLIIHMSGCRFADNGKSGWFSTPVLLRLIDRIAKG